ncbi:MAG TPA: carboxymuconolactone decarboxylase family protein [Stellaceae bacterium]|nr:carboxymuconolactone decarboxylase family protein [Stellaceae bacterium]
MTNKAPSRIREIPAAALTPAQQAAIDAVLGGRGRIPGPYKIWLHSPVLMQRLERLGTFLVTESSLRPREQELAILIVARHWHGDYVFSVHARVARDAGIDDAAIEDIRAGRLPALSDPREAAIVEIATTAQDRDPANDAAFARAIAALGEEGLADLLVFIGYYSAVAIAMKLHRVPAPAG